MKNMTNKQIFIICTTLLVLVFMLSINTMYKLGYHQGLSDICDPLDVGIDMFNDLVCYNQSTKQIPGQTFYIDLSPNTTIQPEEIAWS